MRGGDRHFVWRQISSKIQVLLNWHEIEINNKNKLLTSWKHAVLQ